MNEWIIELAKQADDYADHYCDTVAMSYSNWTSIRDNKFAELVVAACADAADDLSGQLGFIGDYIGESMGFGQEEGVAEWRERIRNDRTTV